MLKGLIHLPWYLRKSAEPKIYDVRCVQCSWRKTVELGEVDENSRSMHGDAAAMEIMPALPGHCPQCGGKLKKQRIKVFLRY